MKLQYEKEKQTNYKTILQEDKNRFYLKTNHKLHFLGKHTDTALPKPFSNVVYRHALESGNTHQFKLSRGDEASRWEGVAK